MEHKNIKLIAFDLDGTLFNSKKEITPATLEVLDKAATMGIEIVPATGRFWNAIPESLRNIKSIHYAITMNGAEVFDVVNSKSISRAEIPPERALNMMYAFNDIPNIIYDCIIDGQGYIKRELFEKIPDFMVGEWQVRLVSDFRKPLETENFYELVRNSKGIQKVQIFTLDKDLRADLLKSLPIVFRKCNFTSSIPNNIEINDINANKGGGLKILAEYLNIKLENTMAFGDGLNDLSMIKNAGIGVAMANSCKELLDVADFVTTYCDNDGVAEGIKKFCF